MLKQSELALKVLSEPRCVPELRKRAAEECPVLLIIGRGSFGKTQYAPKASIKEPSLDSGTNYRRS